MRSLLVCFAPFTVALAACGALSPAPSQVVATATAAECEDFIRVLRKAKDDGLTCEAGKARAEAQEPHCTLEFTCPKVSDGGAE